MLASHGLYLNCRIAVPHWETTSLICTLGYQYCIWKKYTQLNFWFSDSVDNLAKQFSFLRFLIIYFQGFHGIEEDVFLSLPCVLGSHGVMYVIKQTLDESEAKKLQSCARTMHEIQQTLKFWVKSGSYDV